MADNDYGVWGPPPPEESGLLTQDGADALLAMRQQPRRCPFEGMNVGGEFYMDALRSFCTDNAQTAPTLGTVLLLRARVAPVQLSYITTATAQRRDYKFRLH